MMNGEEQVAAAAVQSFALGQAVALLERIAKAQEKRNELLEATNAMSVRSEERMNKLADIQLELYEAMEKLKEEEEDTLTATIKFDSMEGDD